LLDGMQKTILGMKRKVAEIEYYGRFHEQKRRMQFGVKRS